jgi:TetR/AcrR family transcriptional regulator, mexJK operon transcriptional repressor
MEIGTLRRMAPGVAVRCFVGPLLAFLMTKVVFPQPDTDSLSTESMAVTAVDVFLRGMEPDDA